jgi:hypothetical protein
VCSSDLNEITLPAGDNVQPQLTVGGNSIVPASEIAVDVHHNRSLARIGLGGGGERECAGSESCHCEEPPGRGPEDIRVLNQLFHNFHPAFLFAASGCVA